MTDLNKPVRVCVSHRKVLAGSLGMAAEVTLSTTAVPENARANPFSALSTHDH